jgi:hypothetical protein
MANIATVDNWGADVYQYTDGDVLDGGPDSLEVLPIKQLSNRSLYQRLRSVTPWSDVLAAAYGYPQGACVMHSGVSWRAVVTNAVEPGTDPTKWERWGHSDGELAAYLRGSLLSPVRCPVTGPAAVPSGESPYTMWQSVAPYNEYWMWMGDAWAVVANRYKTAGFIASNALPALTATAIIQTTAPRSGVAHLRGIVSAKNGVGSSTVMTAHITRTRAGVNTYMNESGVETTTAVLNQYHQARPFALLDVLAGDVYYLVASVTQAVAAHATNLSSIHLEYHT